MIILVTFPFYGKTPSSKIYEKEVICAHVEGTKTCHPEQKAEHSHVE